MNRKEIGDKGELFAAEYYRKLGYEIKEMNYHSRRGEIDVIAENEEFIVFCEVKTRKANSFQSPSEAVDCKKRENITLTAMQYIEKIQSDKQIRFDVFEVWQNQGRIFKFNNIENAFEAEDFSGRYDIF